MRHCDTNRKVAGRISCNAVNLCRISCHAVDLCSCDTNAVQLCWMACNAIDLCRISCNFVNLCRSYTNAVYLCMSTRNAAGLRSLEYLCIFMYIHVQRYKTVGVEKRIRTGRSKNVGSIPGRQGTFLFRKHAD